MVRFSKFLSSTVVRKIYLIFLPSDQYTEISVNGLGALADEFHISPTNVLDEFARLRVNEVITFSLFSLFNKTLSRTSMLHKLIESALVICPHNMMVESGFSKMKYFENEYRGNLRLDMYNAYRIIADNNFDRETFEEFNILHSLVESVKNANKRYKKWNKID